MGCGASKKAGLVSNPKAVDEGKKPPEPKKAFQEKTESKSKSQVDQKQNQDIKTNLQKEEPTDPLPPSNSSPDQDRKDSKNSGGENTPTLNGKSQSISQTLHLPGEIEHDAGKKKDSMMELKLPDIKRLTFDFLSPRPTLIEVDISERRKRTPTSVKRRLEAQSKSMRRVTGDEVEQKLADAKERRLRHQGMKVRNASKTSLKVEERRKQMQQLEDRKAEQLRKILSEKKRVAEANKQALEWELKKKAEIDALHAQEVATKAKLLKEMDSSGQSLHGEDKENDPETTIEEDPEPDTHL